jgi:hypothetical protein
LTGGTMTIGGSIQGNIVAIGGVVNLDSTAVVNGDLSSIGASVKRDPNAQISGKITEQAPIQLDLNNPESAPIKTTPSLLEKILAITFESLALAALAVVLALLFPLKSSELQYYCQRVLGKRRRGLDHCDRITDRTCHHDDYHYSHPRDGLCSSCSCFDVDLWMGHCRL